MENPGLLSETSTVAKAVTIAALHSKNQHKIWMVRVSFGEEEKQCPLQNLRVGGGKQKERMKNKMGGGKEKERSETIFPEWVTHKLR